MHDLSAPEHSGGAALTPGQEVWTRWHVDLGPHPSGTGRLTVHHDTAAEVTAIYPDGRVGVRETGYGSLPRDRFTLAPERVHPSRRASALADPCAYCDGSR